MAMTKEEQARFDNLTAQVTQLTGELEVANSTVTELTGELEKAEETIEGLQINISELTQAKEALQNVPPAPGISVGVASVYSFMDEEGVHSWFPGTKLTEDEIDFLEDRGVQLVQLEG